MTIILYLVPLLLYPKGENINVVNASCTNQLGFDDFIKRVEPTVISEYRKIRMDDYRLMIFRIITM